VATSAVREAKNKHQFVEQIFKKSKIQIEVIDGIEEARLIHLAVHKELDLHNKKIMLIDIGGGSVEITFSENGYMSATKSFPMGTVRILDHLQKRHLTEKDLNLIIGDFLEPLIHHIESQQGSHQLDFAVGTGGNLECMGKLRKLILGKTPTTHLTYKELTSILEEVKKISIKDRQAQLDMRPDRVDVIVPAMTLVQTILRLSETQRLVIPGVGLRDGLLWSTAGF
jgi:exopolyphosphatase/guanosine-5'-triphosphate,3'-diphosphate pyrophosphatase